jgi:hypothetical protein
LMNLLVSARNLESSAGRGNLIYVVTGAVTGPSER